MKKKISLGFVFAMVLVLLAAAALATTLLLSPRANAVKAADEAVKEKYGITAELQTFFGREEKELPEGGVEVAYTGAGNMAYALGTYTVTVKDGKATEVTWSHDGEDTSGGYDAEAWGLEQLNQMLTDCRDESLKQAYLDRTEEIAFRGFLFGKSSKVLPKWACFLLSAALFALGHMASGNSVIVFYDLALIFLDAIMYALAYQYSGNCIISYIPHCLNNILGLFLIRWLFM